MRTPLPRGLGLDGLVGLGGAGVVDGFVDLVADALHAFLEAAQPFAKALAELRELLASEEDDNDDREDDEMPRLKQVAHTFTLQKRPTRAGPVANLIVAQRGLRGLGELKIRADMGRTLYLG